MSEIPGLNQHHSSSDLFTALSVEAHPRNEALISSGLRLDYFPVINV